jgi:hypothetical protein
MVPQEPPSPEGGRPAGNPFLVTFFWMTPVVEQGGRGGKGSFLTGGFCNRDRTLVGCAGHSTDPVWAGWQGSSTVQRLWYLILCSQRFRN